MGYASTVDTGQAVPWALFVDDPSTYGGNAASANTAYFVGVTLPTNATLTGIRVRFDTGGNGNYDVGIYNSAGTLLTNKGAAVSSTATLTWTLGTPLPLAPGNYWLALWVASASDQPYSRNANNRPGVDIMQSVSASSNLPATMSGAANASFKPFIIGLLSGGWS